MCCKTLSGIAIRAPVAARYTDCVPARARLLIKASVGDVLHNTFRHVLRAPTGR
jgi:hypothetical protein